MSIIRYAQLAAPHIKGERWKAVLAMLAALALYAPNASDAAQITCFCKVSSDNLSGVCHPDSSQILFDLTGTVNKAYDWPRTETKWQDCKLRCSDAANAAKNAVAAAACRKGVAGGTTFRAYAALGNCGKKGEYAAAGTFGKLINTPAITETTCVCPQGWTPNAPKCSKYVNESGWHYPDQTCAQSVANFEATVLSSPFFQSKCTEPTKLIAVHNITCQNTPIPGFPTPGGSVLSASLCCGAPGNTTDGRCKTVACQPNNVMPPPLNGTPIGTLVPPYGTSPSSWGFSWGNTFYAWGNAANGGLPTNCKTDTLTPAVCTFQ